MSLVVEPDKLNIQGIKGFVDKLNTHRVNTVDTIIGATNNTIIGNECYAGDSNCIIIGYQGFSTTNDQLVLAAGKNNILRFNSDGIVTYNGDLVTQDSEILEYLRDILKKCYYFELTKSKPESGV